MLFLTFLRPVLLGALVLAGAPALHAQAAAPAEVRALDSLFAAAYPADGPGAAVIVARGGEVLLRKGYGLASVELGVPASPEHVFRIGSITKQFTAVAILLLVEEGKLSLDDEVTRFFPGWPTHGHRITVEHLLTHTSGIRSYTSIPAFGAMMRTALPLERLIASFRDEPMDFAPGTDFRYNNSGYVLLGAIVEQLSGQRYAEFLRTRIFEPLQMRDTRFDETDAVIPRRAAGHAIGAGRQVRNAGYLSMSLPHAAGSLVSTVEDQLRWQRAVAEGRLLSAATWRRALTPFRLADGRGSGYGYGWFLGTAAGEATVEHGGDINGFASEGLWIPSRDLHVVVLANAERSYANPATLTVGAAERVLGRTGAAPAVALAPEALDAFVGVYAVSETERRGVRREGAVLVTVRGTSAPQELRPLGGDAFVYPSTRTRVTFVRDAAGRITGMRLHPRLGPDQRADPRIAADPDAAAAAAPAPVAVAAAVLDAYVGEYELAPEFVITIRRSGEGIALQATGQPQVTLDARSETRFTLREVPAAVEFQRDEGGAVTGLVLDQGGRRMPARRIR